MSILWLSLGFGLVTASILALSSVGLSLQFGVTNYVNFAYGSFLSLGMFVTWTLTRPFHLPFWIGAPVAVVITGVVAVIVDRVALEPFVRRGGNLLYLLIVTFGLSLILDNAMQAVWGVDFHRYALGQGADLHLGPFQFTVAQLAIVAIAAVVMVGVHLLLTRTRLGKAMRAMSDNPLLAQGSGVDTRWITTATWFISGCLAGAGGVALAMNIVSFQTTSGDDLLFVIFAAVILGGIGRTYGAMLGALVIGLVTEVSAVYVGSAYKSDVAFLILVIVLVVRPQGLLPAQGKA